MAILDVCVQYWPALLGGLVLTYFLHNHFHGGLYKIPGPWARSFAPLARVWSVYTGQSQNDDIALHNKYGEIVRIAPKMISISTPSEMDQIYGISTNFFKSQFFEPTRVYDDEGILPDPFVIQDKEMHGRMKRNAANAYSLNALVQLEPLVDPVIIRMVAKMTEYAKKDESLDMGKLLQWFAFDTIFTVTFGKDMAFMEKGDSKGWLESMGQSLVYIAVVGQISWIHKYLMGSPYIARLVEGDPEDGFFGSALKIAHEQFVALKQELKESPSPDQNTFLHRLLLNQMKNPKSITDRELNTHTFGNIIAGSDTTAVALRAVVISLLNNADAYAKLCEEVRGSELPFPVSWARASKLTYLNAVIKEAIRLHPSVGMILAREVPAGGAKICGYYVPAGTEVGINPWIVQRDPKVFPDPEHFEPERWLKASPEQLKEMNRHFFAFGGGRHTCSGQHISILEITKLIPTLLLKFDLEWASLEAKMGVRTWNYFFTVQKGLIVKVRQVGEKA